METLLLLVGTNPLPNLIVATHCIQNCKGLQKIVLLHTEQTKETASRLELAITAVNGIQLEFQKVRIRNELGENFSAVEADFIHILNQLPDKTHLDFTGGKKWMSVFLVKGLSSIVDKKFTYSYLENQGPKLISSNPHLPSKVKCPQNLKIQHLLACHGYKLADADGRLAPAFRIWLKSISEEIVREAILNGPKLPIQKFRPGSGWKDLRKKKKWQSEFVSRIQNAQESNRVAIQNCPILKGLVDTANQTVEGLVPDYRFVELDLNAKCELAVELLQLLEGQWTELWVQHCLDSLQSDSSFELQSNCKAQSDRTPSDKVPELDLLLRVNWSLILVSVTSAKDRGTVKGKAFEAYHRARQIGGDHAFAVVVSKIKEDGALELTSDLNNDDFKNVQVCGIDTMSSSQELHRVVNDVIRRLGV
ncbi:MAG: hypothetical protein H3C47_06310 [Candidatus Cloacimonetes bacterium]|nr:hypothetical protein [Candidatus Cloacimonadota bacterium]